MADEHLIPLTGTEWHAWRHALVRSAGFPARGMDRFAAPGLAATADRLLAGEATDAELDAAFEQADAALGDAVFATASDPRFRAALAWQNPGALQSVEGVLRGGPDAKRNASRRRKEELVAKYWQRYCLKNDTVGFFGPMCWTTLTDDGPELTATPGPGLTRARVAHFEWWALAALGEHFAADPRIRPWLPVRLQPHLTVRDRAVLAPREAPQPVSPATAALLDVVRTRVRAADVAAALVGGGGDAAGFRRDADVHAQLAELAGRGLVRIGFDLPMDLSAEAVLREQLGGVGDEAARTAALAALDELCALRDAAAAATGPDAIAAALGALARRFTEITGQDTQQRAGQNYAGRTLTHLETTRDLDLAFGGDLPRRLAALEPLLRSARWLTAAAGDAYVGALAELYHVLAGEADTPDIPFADLWGLAQGVVFGDRPPTTGVTSDFLRRWSDVLGLGDVEPGTRELTFTAAELGERVAKAFPADAPGWALARLHSPDLHVCAPDAAAVERGDYTVVLGELHIGAPTFNTHFFSLGHPQPAQLLAAMAADLPHGRMHPLLPTDWPLHTGRVAEWLHTPHDGQIGFVPAPGPDPARHVPITELTVGPGPEGLRVRAADGREWPLVDAFASLFDHQTFDTWKLAGGAEHTPRITVDGLVLVRETWRARVGDTGLADVHRERERYLAVRRWRRELGLPERVFVRVDAELKPFFVDLTSPLYARILCTMLRGARIKAGDDVGLTVTELLPGPDDAWLADAAGERYASELRLQLRDPALPPG